MPGEIKFVKSMRVHNFNAGPAALPLPVLEKVATELANHPGVPGLEVPALAGMSVMEMSHRSDEFEAVRDYAEAGLRRLMGLSDQFSVLFLQGGATLQFSMVPMNVLADGARADYLVHGAWGVKALKEAQKFGSARVAATTNETIEGVQWPTLPDTQGVPLIADMSSDILSAPLDAARFGLLYAGAQKNIGPSGVTVVVIRRDWIEPRPALATMLDYSIHDKDRSLHNTPNTFGIYMIGHVCDWIEENGGLEGMARRNAAKAALLYEAIDASDFYQGFAETTCRSKMNVTFRLPGEDLETRFASEATEAGLIGLKGHRSVGGIRASLYNAVELASVEALTAFMREFEVRNG